MLQQWLEGLPKEQRASAELWGRRSLVVGALTLFILIGTLALSIETLLEGQNTLQLQVDEVAPEDILAPSSLVYNSAVLTEQAQQEAIARVQPVYDPNPDVTREQIRFARNVTIYINEIRHDSYASQTQQVEDLLLINSLALEESAWGDILALSDTRWELISTEISALVERTMQRDIRPDNLEATRGSLFNSVASRFSNSETALIVAVSEDILMPNTFLNQEETDALRDEAAASVVDREQRFEAGQRIVSSGDIISDLEMEALQQFGLLQADAIEFQTLLGAFVAMFTTTIILGLYIERFYVYIFQDQALLAVLAILFLLFLIGINAFGVQGTNEPYLYPAAALGFLLTTLVAPQLAIVVMSILAILIGTTQPQDTALQLTSYTLVGSIMGILSMRHIERLNSYFVGGLVVSLGNVFVVTAFALLAEEPPSFGDVASQLIIASGNGLFAAGIALIGLYIITSLLNITTSLKLIELMDPKQGILQRLLREAPGTYQHSLQVANLSELAADAIGGDSQLVRVAAMYHDMGKMLNPFYFGENTAEGMNPHNDLNDPVQSAKVIIGHVIEGERMARRANLPMRIRDFILEHHGTTQALYFYNQALDRADIDDSTVNIKDFTYPGPSPRSRETAIMMLADGCESATRSARPAKKSDIEEMVNTIFELRLSEGQLDNSGLTLNDLKTVRHIFIETLQAMYHPRIAYKKRDKPFEDRDTKTKITSGIVKHLEAPLPLTSDGQSDSILKDAKTATQDTEAIAIAEAIDPDFDSDADVDTDLISNQGTKSSPETAEFNTNDSGGNRDRKEKRPENTKETKPKPQAKPKPSPKAKQ